MFKKAKTEPLGSALQASRPGDPKQSAPDDRAIYLLEREAGPSAKAPMASWSQVEGSPQALGCTWLESEQSFNFALFSRHATSVTLLLFTAHDLINPALCTPLDHLTHKSGQIWHCR